MTPPSPIRSRRAALAQAVVPVALLGLVALVGGLTLHARRIESSHRATAENALRDYAAFAAWQFSHDAGDYVHQSAHVTLHAVDQLFRERGSARRTSSTSTLSTGRSPSRDGGSSGLVRAIRRRSSTSVA